MKPFSKHWISSSKPRKQRKYVFNAPLHIRKNLMSVNISKDIRKKYKTRNISIRKGDRVKIMRGQFKKRSGKVEDVNLKALKVYVEGIERTKRDGSKSKIPINPSNLQIIELNLEDKYRKQKMEQFIVKK